MALNMIPKHRVDSVEALCSCDVPVMRCFGQQPDTGQDCCTLIQALRLCWQDAQGELAVDAMQFQWVSKASIGMPAMPQQVLNQYQNNPQICFFDIMPEIGRAWATVDNTLFIWRIGDKCETSHVSMQERFTLPVPT